MSEKQGILSYRVESEQTSQNLTALSGLAPYLDLMVGSGLVGSVCRNLGVCGEQGWTDHEMVMSLVLLNLAGGDCVDDLDQLNADNGFSKLLKWCADHGLPRRVRREMKRRWRKAKTRSVVSPSVARRWLGEFQDEGQEKLRIAGKAFIPKPNEHLLGLRDVNSEFVGWVQGRSPQLIATLDLDATLLETSKSDALFCYQGYRAYQPLNVWWAEQELMLSTEFRDGNVPAGWKQLRVVKEAYSHLPLSVKVVRLRSDSAGYEHTLLRWCDCEKNKRVGRIEFAVSCDVSREFKTAVSEVDEDDWHPLYKEVNGEGVKTGREWAEVCFVPQAIAFGNKAPVYRYIATREPLAERVLPGMESEQLSLPFQTVSRGGVSYKLFGVVTNLDWDGNDVIRFHDGRSGKCEEAHKVLKEDFAGGTMPSNEFGANAAWWQIAVLAMNIASAMKRVVLGGVWASRRMKAIRFLLIGVPGRVVEKARQIYLRLSSDHPALELVLRMRLRIRDLATGPPLAA
jgi:Transposase DDE domain group 1